MSSFSHNPLKRLIREIHRRSLWQVLGIYLVGSWAVLSAVDTLGGALNLPDWFPQVALALLIVGLPIVLATAFVQVSDPSSEDQQTERHQTGDSGGERKAQSRSRATGVSQLLTWRNALFGGVGALALWGLLAAGWLIAAGGALGTGDSASIVLSAVAEVDDAMDRGDWIEAYNLARVLPPQVPDSAREAIFSSASTPARVVSVPEGATLYWRPYDRPDMAWEVIGTTPVEWRGPRDGVLLKLDLEGYETRSVGTFAAANPVHLRQVNAVQPDAVHVPARDPLNPAAVEARLAHQIPPRIGEYLIDRYEVTNAQFKEFVDARAYERQEFWKHPFERDGEALDWAEAMAEFVDLTGRPGPSTWTGGSFPEGTADYPVTGISWYEAAAYADFAGRELPTVFHWSVAASPVLAKWVVPFSNFGGEGLAPVGEFAGVSQFGAYDMAGNAREWLANATGTGNRRYTAGGGWNDLPYLFSLTQPQPPFDRSETNGLRLMTNLGDAAAFAVANQPVEPVIRDFYGETPASDELFTEFARLYEYADTPLNERVEAVDTLDVGIRERITFDAGYGGERVILYLFRPVETARPLQTVVLFPGSSALSTPRFGESGRAGPRVSMVVRSGRAFAYPVYKSTFERGDDYFYRLQDPSNDHREHVLQWRQDLGRSLDYLQTRPDVDSSRFAYFGVSWGGRMGGIMLAVEPRFRTAVLEVPGLSPLPTQPVVDPFNFVPRVHLPVLMMSGEYDQTYPLETAARPFFDFLGTDSADKKHFIAAGGHIIPTVDLTRETLDWLDRYLGEVR